MGERGKRDVKTSFIDFVNTYFPDYYNVSKPHIDLVSKLKKKSKKLTYGPSPLTPFLKAFLKERNKT